MAYKIVNGKLASTNKREQMGGQALGLQVDEVSRKIHMVRMRVDKQGACHEENRTTFHQPAWLDFTQAQWIKHRDGFLQQINDMIQNQQGLSRVGNSDSPVKVKVF